MKCKFHIEVMEVYEVWWMYWSGLASWSGGNSLKLLLHMKCQEDIEVSAVHEVIKRLPMKWTTPIEVYSIHEVYQ